MLHGSLQPPLSAETNPAQFRVVGDGLFDQVPRNRVENGGTACAPSAMRRDIFFEIRLHGYPCSLTLQGDGDEHCDRVADGFERHDRDVAADDCGIAQPLQVPLHGSLREVHDLTFRISADCSSAVSSLRVSMERRFPRLISAPREENPPDLCMSGSKSAVSFVHDRIGFHLWTASGLGADEEAE